MGDAEEFDPLASDLLSTVKYVPDNANPTGDPLPWLDSQEWELYVRNNPWIWGWGEC